MSEEIPMWAEARALELAKPEGIGRGLSKTDGHYYGDMVKAFARYIAEHEEPPVDPLLVEAREIVKATLTPANHKNCNCREQIDAGEWDSGHKVRASLAALRRGIELAAKQ